MDTSKLSAPARTERLASAWLGVNNPEQSEQHYPSAQLDLVLNAWLGRVTGNISPAALANAYFDWLTHLALSPTKQAKLIQKAAQKVTRWSHFMLDASCHDHSAQAPCIVPLPQDKRFDAPAWQQWPFNALAQGFLLNQQWWHRATTGIRGVSRHHEDVVTFTTRQLLDMMAPSNFLLTNPVVLEETVQRNGANLIAGAQRAYADWLRQFSGIRAPRHEDFKVGEAVAVTPGKVVYRNRLIELIQYTPSTPSVHARPLLCIPAWIMKYYILDLSPPNSLVRYLVGKGHTVFMISWKNPDANDRDLSMEDYRKLGVMDALDAVTRITGAPDVNALGYCLGGTLLSIAAASMARDGDRRLASVTLLASQVDFTEPGELSLFIDESQISFLEAIMWYQGYLNTRQMAGAFHLLRSHDLIWSRRLNQYLLGLPDQETDLTAWNADATRMPYRMHSDYLRQLFLNNALAAGRYRTDGRTIGLTDIEAPIFAVGTLTDHVAPWRSVYKIHLLTDTEVTFLLTSGGHNAGVVSPPGQPRRAYQVARHAHEDPYVDADTWQQSVAQQQGSWWPEWASWLAGRAGELGAPPPMGPDLGDAPGLYVLQR